MFIMFSCNFLSTPCIIFVAVAVVAVAGQSQFKLKNAELYSFKIDVNQSDGKTLVSRRNADGVAFIEDQQTGQLKSATGLCIQAARDGALELVSCEKTTEQWHLYQSRYFKGFFLGPKNDYMACWDTGRGWRGPYENDGKPLSKRKFEELPGGVGCAWRTA